MCRRGGPELDLYEKLLHERVHEERRDVAAAGADGGPDPVGGEPLSADERGGGGAELGDKLRVGTASSAGTTLP
jgi:hypothetical protein